MSYKSRSAGEQALADRQHTINVCRELIADPRVSEDDRGMYMRFLKARDRFAPEPPEHPIFAEFRKRNRYKN
jgi:hypothetical protein